MKPKCVECSAEVPDTVFEGRNWEWSAAPGKTLFDAIADRFARVWRCPLHRTGTTLADILRENRKN
jgi:hypothetical protein